MKLPKKVLAEFNKYPPFYRKVWKIVSKIPRGKVLTYGEVAKLAGKPGGSRAVGNALGANPFAPIVPCHRVIRKDGSMGGYSAKGGVKKKLQMLLKEGAITKCKKNGV
jgi:O-6-methylguanine DNA methyltransferase